MSEREGFSLGVEFRGCLGSYNGTVLEILLEGGRIRARARADLTTDWSFSGGSLDESGEHKYLLLAVLDLNP